MFSARISDALAGLVKALTPKKRRSVLHPRWDHTPLAYTLDAERLHGILRSAEQGDTKELFGLYREIVTGDSHVSTEFGKRKLAILGDAENVLPRTQNDVADERAAEACKELTAHPDWMDAMKWLLDSTIFPVCVLEKVFKPSSKPGLRFELKSLKGVPYRLLDYTEGRLRIEDTNEAGMPLGTYHEPDPDRYIVHRGHLLTTPDEWGGPMRAVLFWWLFVTMGRDWWIRFIERYGSPFIVGKFDKGDDESRSILMSAFGTASRLLGLVITRETEVELHQAGDKNTGEVFEKFARFAQEQISKVIVGQTLSSDSKPQGIGTGATELHSEVRQDFRQWDSKVTGNTLRCQLFAQYLAINGIAGQAPTMQWGGESGDDNKTTAEVVKIYNDAGLRVKEESIPVLNQRLGLELERAPAPPAAPGLTTFAANGQPLLNQDPRLALAHAGAADLSRAFRGRLAPIARIVRESKTAAECEARITAFMATASQGDSVRVLEEALVAYAANAIKANP
jgi:phage gp29-like protein